MKFIVKIGLLVILTPFNYQYFLQAQEVYFNQVNSINPLQNLDAEFVSVSGGKSQFIDIDFDGDQDVYISNHASLYLNDGNGNFSKKPIALEELVYSSHAISDFNNDGLLDIIQSGLNQSGQRVTQLYISDSLYHFSLDSNTSFIGLALSHIDVADINGDNNFDFIIVGRDSNSMGRTRLYLNQGNMNFTESNVSFPDVGTGSVNFEDIDQDGNPDLLLTGNNLGTRITKLYINDSVGNFTEVSNHGLDQVYAGVSHFFDADLDNDLDLILTGDNRSNQRITKLYINDGQNSFSEKSTQQFIGSFDGSIASGYVNSDSLPDLIVTGYNSNPIEETSTIYLNYGNASFQVDTSNSIIGTARGSTSFSDINSDGFQDLLITGETDMGNGISSIYLNENGRLSELTDSPFKELFAPKLTVLDYNNDSLPDIFLSGIDRSVERTNLLYTNNGSQFSLKKDSIIPPVYISSSISKDFNGDQFPDLLISGSTYPSFEPVCQVFINDQNGNFNLSPSILLDSINASNMLYLDLDLNGHKDIFINGVNKKNELISMVYFSSSQGNFAQGVNSSIPPFNNGHITYADIDNDGDQDIFTAGRDSSSSLISNIFINDGNGAFSSNVNQNFKQLQQSFSKFVDIDRDQDQDLFLMGRDRSLNTFSALYLNDGLGNFSKFNDFNFQAVANGSVHFLDIDGDHYLDVYIAGIDHLGRSTSKFYLQYNKLDFREVINSPIEGYSTHTGELADFNQDGLLDIAMSGLNDKLRNKTKVYLNNTCQVTFVKDSITACDSILWKDSITYYDNNPHLRHRSFIANGCDTVFNTSLKVNHSSRSYYSDTTCKRLFWNSRIISRSGTYLDTLENSQNCDSIISLELNVNLLIDTIYRHNDSIFYKVDTTANISWLNCSKLELVSNPDTGFFILPNQDSYAIILDNNECRDTSSCFSIVGLSETNFKKSRIQIFPNPGSDIITIKTKRFKKNNLAFIYNIEGQLVQTIKIDRQETKLNIQHLEKGIYLFQTNNQTIKFVKL